MFKIFFDKKAAIIEQTDPDRIYVENVRSFFNISTRLAKLLCQLAVRQGIFKKKFGVECKNKSCLRIINIYKSKEEIPKHIECLTCQLEGDLDFKFETTDLEIIEYYQYLQNGK